MSDQQKKPSRISFRDLESLDKEITLLLGKRVELLSGMATKRKDNKRSLVDPVQEKALWETWKTVRDEFRLDANLWSKLFGLCNALSYAKAEKADTDKGYVLKPSSSPLKVDIAGPKHLFISLALTALGGAGGQKFQLPDVILNDPLIELVKALNQTGSSITWEHSSVGSENPSLPDFDGKVIFSGNDPLVFYFLLSMAVFSLGTVKFTGGANLRVLDFTTLTPFLTSLGTRVVMLDPHTSGLPVRLECSGDIPAEIHLPEDLPREFARAFILTASAMEKAVTVTWPAEKDSSFFPPEILHIFQLTDCGHTLLPHGVRLNGASLGIPEEIPLDLDPTLSATLLSMVVGLGGGVTLQGTWPEWSNEGCRVMDLLTTFLTVTVKKDSIHAKKKKLSGKPSLGTSSHLFPWAFALALLCEKDVDLDLDSQPEDVSFAREVLDALDIDYNLDTRQPVPADSQKQTGSPASIMVPDARWAFALALLALAYPKITLINPGIITSVWPQFWNIYNTLPSPSVHKRKKENDNRKNKEKSKRRITVD